MIPIIRPDLTFDEVSDDLRRILDSGTLTNGPYLAAFEAHVAEAVGVRHAVATTSATTALHLALVALGVGPGDEVVLSDFSFPATANVVVQAGAVPVLADCAAGSFAVDPERVEALLSPKTKALLIVDPFGQPADLRALTELAAAQGIPLLEDAACALGASIAGQACGSWPGAGCFSFHPRKVVTTGEGGAVTTDDDTLARRLRVLRSHGGTASGRVGLQFVENGFNYRLSEVQAALGLAQLRRLDGIVQDRRTTAARYDELLAPLDAVAVHRPAPDEKWTYQSYVVVVDPGIDRDAVVAGLARRSVETTLGTYAQHAQPSFARFGYAPGDLPRSLDMQQRSLTLPLLPRMAIEQQEEVAEALTAVLVEVAG